MGNVSSVKLKEDIAHLEINEKLVHDFQYYIKLVDHSMAAFVRTTNSLRESFATVKQHVNEGNGDSSVNDADGGEEFGHAPKHMTILETIDDALSDQSFIIVDSLTRLLNFIIETGKRCNAIIPDDALLFINKYKSKSETFADALDKEMQYHDAVIESLQKKLKRVTEEQRMAKKEIDNLTEREASYLEEKQRLYNKIHDLETNSSNLKVKLENIRKDKNVLETKNEKLEKKVNDLIRRNEDAERDINIGQSNFEMLGNTLQSEKDECLRKVNASRKEKEELQKILID
ncbi:uncharacterized protein LOC132749231 [Ruditapes philippinarum]|uniref:uncharacterized protein LOC132749231 n=1 Tax=Ruditapes philippinarum TaxID=129788 RepID=UPI00295BC290|nr:uncharacterized protein LOC132749231 [Ruditapes philippinarum]